MEQRRNELFVSYFDMVDHAASLDPNFKNESEYFLRSRFYKHIKRSNLTACRYTRNSQIIREVMENVSRDFLLSAMDALHNQIFSKDCMLSMDQTSLHFNCAPRATVRGKVERTISVKIAISSFRLTLCVTVAVDGTKLAFLFVMNGETVERIERQLHGLLHTSVLECCQLNVWMEKIAM